jgi:hypothetical protein
MFSPGGSFESPAIPLFSFTQFPYFTTFSAIASPFSATGLDYPAISRHRDTSFQWVMEHQQLPTKRVPRVDIDDSVMTLLPPSPMHVIGSLIKSYTVGSGLLFFGPGLSAVTNQWLHCSHSDLNHSSPDRTVKFNFNFIFKKQTTVYT